jgi:hypothetical protein
VCICWWSRLPLNRIKNQGPSPTRGDLALRNHQNRQPLRVLLHLSHIGPSTHFPPKKRFWKCYYLAYLRPRWRSWLRHCATNRQVAGTIPDGVSGIFHWHNPVSRTMDLGSTQPLTEMSTRNISWGLNTAGAYGWKPTTFMCRLSRNLGPRPPGTLWACPGL